MFLLIRSIVTSFLLEPLHLGIQKGSMTLGHLVRVGWEKLDMCSDCPDVYVTNKRGFDDIF